MLHAMKVAFLVILAVAAAVALFTRPAIPQPEAYHAFADGRTMLHVPNALNVASNVFFLVFGLMGLRFLARKPSRDPDAPRPGSHTAFETYRERPAYVIFFLGVLLTAFGSSYYHLAPSTTRLFWDRLPMSIAFMALFSAVISERVSIYWSRMLLLPLVFVGIGTVVAWRVSEAAGHGDLRAYLFVQLFPMAAIPFMMLLFPSRYTRAWELVVVIVLYAGAKALEWFDGRVYVALHAVVSGHTLKHVVAALATYVVMDMLKRRHPRPE